MSSTAILFPGQGCLTPDAAEQAQALWPELVDQATELVGEDPFASAADSTRFAQPAIFVASMAAWRDQEPALDGICAMAGHSLGEFSALAAAGALAVEDGLRLVVLRAQLMADAAEQHPGGGMVALLGVEPDAAAELAQRYGVAVANDNAPGQIVVSGNGEALAELVAAAREAGLRTMELDVAGAFHSPDMGPAELPFRRALEETPMSPPSVPVVSCFTTSQFTDLPAELSRAIVSPVRWRETMASLVELGATEFVDVGPGQVLARLVKRNVVEREGHVVAV